MLIFLFIGTGLFAFYQSGAGILPLELMDETKSDRIFPYFIVTELPRGITGLMIASIFAAGMSTISTSFNSSATVFFTDYYQRYFNTGASEKDAMRVLYISSFVIGIIGITISILMINVKSALDTWWKLASIFSGGSLGLFLLGVFSKSKSLISNNQTKPRLNDTLAIRGTIIQALMWDKKNNGPTIIKSIDNENISIFLGSNFHSVVYPMNPYGGLNYIAIMKYKLSLQEQKNYSLFNDESFARKVLGKIPIKDEITSNLKDIKIFPVFVSDDFYQLQNNNIHLIGDAFFAFPPSFAQGASQSIEGAYELFKSIENNSESSFFKNRVRKTKMVNNRSKLNQFAFHLSNPLTVFFRNIFLKRLVKNKKFLENYLGKVYKN